MLVKCPECGKEVSDKAASCPNCGCPISEIILSKEQTSENAKDDSKPKNCPKCGNPLNERGFCETCVRNDAIKLKYPNRHTKQIKPKGSCFRHVLTGVGVLILIVGLMSYFSDHDYSSNYTVDEKGIETTPQKEEFTTKLKYRDFLTHPDDHIGEKIYCKVVVFDATDKYCKAYLASDFGKILFLHNKSDEKIVSGDTLIVYGIFNGNDETVNSLTCEKGEIVALDVYFFDLLDE